MKIKLTSITILCSFLSFGQSSNEFYENGLKKHQNQDYKGAIKEYTKVVKENKENKDAYFNRGTCEFALKDFDAAMEDFTKVIELDPADVKAYYSRATVFVSKEKYAEALPDLNKAYKIAPSTPNLLTLRGQILAATGDKNGACKDFNEAKTFGDKQADTYLQKYCGNKQLEGESLLLNWPENEKWKIGNSQENASMAMLELIHSNETLEKWTEFGNMMSIKGALNIPMENAMNMMFEQTKKNAPKAKLTFIEKDEKTEYPWIIFTIESPSFKNDKTPESQLWYVVQGKTALYTNFRAVKQATIPADLKDKWTAFFKTGKIVYK